MDGHQLLAALRAQDGEIALIPLIMITARAGEDEKASLISIFDATPTHSHNGPLLPLLTLRSTDFSSEPRTTSPSPSARGNSVSLPLVCRVEGSTCFKADLLRLRLSQSLDVISRCKWASEGSSWSASLLSWPFRFPSLSGLVIAEAAPVRISQAHPRDPDARRGSGREEERS